MVFLISLRAVGAGAERLAGGLLVAARRRRRAAAPEPHDGSPFRIELQPPASASTSLGAGWLLVPAGLIALALRRSRGLVAVGRRARRAAPSAPTSAPLVELELQAVVGELEAVGERQLRRAVGQQQPLRARARSAATAPRPARQVPAGRPVVLAAHERRLAEEEVGVAAELGERVARAAVARVREDAVALHAEAVRSMCSGGPAPR